MILASLAVLLRPTSIITFLLLLPFSLSKNLLLHAIVIGPTTLLSTLTLDTWYFRRPTLPAWNFLKFNLLHDISVFYGTMAWHYYFTQGLPLLLATFLPFTVHGLVSHLRTPFTVLLVGIVLAFSCIGHKEVRFLSPLTPLLLTLSGYSISRLPKSLRTYAVVPGVLLLHLSAAYYVTRIHQVGVIDVMHYLRTTTPQHSSVGFLMPCYSTPWQSYLQRPDLELWKLSCDPPLQYPHHFVCVYG